MESENSVNKKAMQSNNKGSQNITKVNTFTKSAGAIEYTNCLSAEG